MQLQRGQTAREVVLSVVCEPLDWYFTPKDGFQWHDTIGLLPDVPGEVGRWGDDAFSLVGRHWDDTLSWQDNVAKAADNRVIRWGVEGSYDVAKEAAERYVPILPVLFRYNNSSSIDGYQLHHLWPEGLGGPRDGWAIYVQVRPDNFHTARGGLQPWVDQALRNRTGLKQQEMRRWARENPNELIPMLREIYLEIGIDFPY